jgi:hypothetical protein
MTIDLSKPLSELIVEIATNPRTAAQQMQDMQTRLNGRTYFHSDDAVEKELAECQADLETVAAYYQSLGADLIKVADERDRAVAELAAAREIIEFYEVWIRDHTTPRHKDHACSLCVPDGPMVIDGFVCPPHRAEKGCFPTPSAADKVQAVLEAAEEYINRLPHEIGPQMLMQSGVDKLYEAVRALREKG